MRLKPGFGVLGVVGLLVLVVSPVIPVGAHVTDSLDHLTNHLDERYVRKVRITRRAVCPWTDFFPLDSTKPYSNFDAGRTGGPGTFRCGVPIPRGATIEDLGAAVYDDRADGQVGPCTLKLIRLAPASGPVGEFDLVAQTPASGVTQMPGSTLLRTTNIVDSYEEVSDSNHAYWIDCPLSIENSFVRIHGAFVTYTITRGS